MATYTSTFNFYNNFSKAIAEGMNLGSDVLKIGLTSSSYTPSASAHTVLTDITNELSGNGYSRQTLSSVTWTRSGLVTTLDSADPVFTASGGSIVARYWFIFNDTVASKPLIAYGLINNADTDVTATAGNTLTFQINASGILEATV